MIISSDDRIKRLLATREAASTFVEDIHHIRDTLAKADKISAGEIRRLSAVLRRLLLDSDLRSIAPPRIGKLSFTIPDNDPIYTVARKNPIRLFISGGLHIFNNEVRALVDFGAGNLALNPVFDKTRTIEVTIDGFINQRVLAHNNVWVARGHVIKYIANSGSGVHSKIKPILANSPSDSAIIALRQLLKFTKVQDTTTAKLTFDPVAFSGIHNDNYNWTPDSIDSVLIEILCAAHFLAISPDIHALELAIQKEFGFADSTSPNAG